jgi:Metallo-peptidase family M12B Reprolysin-like
LDMTILSRALTAAAMVSFALLSSAVTAGAPLWSDAESAQVLKRGERKVIADRSRTMSLDFGAMLQLLQTVPREIDVAVPDSEFEIDLPLPEGGFARFRVVETPVMAPELAARFPSIKTYLAQDVNNPATTARLDITARGFRAQVIANTHTSFIEPYQIGDVSTYTVFNKSDYTPDREPMRCHVTGQEIKSKPNLLSRNSVVELAGPVSLRTYRIAITTTGEYTAAQGGRVLDGLSAVVTTLNRVNGLFEREVAARFQLVANNDRLIYTNALTDPFTDPNLASHEGNSVIEALIGNANYDVGHTFNTGGGGGAYVGSLCASSYNSAMAATFSTPKFLLTNWAIRWARTIPSTEHSGFVASQVSALTARPMRWAVGHRSCHTAAFVVRRTYKVLASLTITAIVLTRCARS